ncbi:hypothetical protein FCV25MIE_14071 [Fagus crenata]
MKEKVVRHFGRSTDTETINGEKWGHWLRALNLRLPISHRPRDFRAQSDDENEDRSRSQFTANAEQHGDNT